MITPNYMFNPMKFGLMSGAADMFGGLAHGLQMQMVLNNRLSAYREKYSQMADVQKAREEHNMMLAKLKVQQSALQQKARVVSGPDGKLYKEYSHAEYDPNSNTYNRVVDGREPIQTAQEKQQAIFDRMDRSAQTKSAHDDRIDSRTQAREAAKTRQQTMGSANADIKAAQKEFDKVNDGVDSDVRKMRDEYRKKPDELNAAMASAGLDPTDPKAKSAFLKSEEDDIRNGAKDQIGRAQKALDDAKAARDGMGKSPSDGSPQIKYGPDGTPYIKGADGKPVPYRAATTDTDSGDTSPDLADNSSSTQSSDDDLSVPPSPGDLNDPLTQQYLALASNPDSFTGAKPPAQQDEQGPDQGGLMGVDPQMQADRAQGDAEWAQSDAGDDQQGLMGAYG